MLCCFRGAAPLDLPSYLLYNMTMKTGEPRPISAIRIKPDILHQARIAAVTRKKTLGQWLEEAITEKIKREQKEGRGRNESSALCQGKHR